MKVPFIDNYVENIEVETKSDRYIYASIGITTISTLFLLLFSSVLTILFIVEILTGFESLLAKHSLSTVIFLFIPCELLALGFFWFLFTLFLKIGMKFVKEGDKREEKESQINE